MRRAFAVIGALTVALAGSMAMAQERVAPTPEMRAKLALEAAQVGFAVKVRAPLEAKVVTGAPYSADVITESVETLADGNRIVHRTTGRVYRDGQGRVRREEDRGAGQAPTASISDPVANVSFTLDPDARVALKGEAVIFNLKTDARAPGDDAAVLYYKMAADPGDVERKRMIEQKLIEQQLANAGEARERMTRRAPSWESEDAQRWDEKVEQLPARDVEGVKAEGTRITRTIPAGAIGNERPIAMVTEEWRSADLQVLVSTTTSDPRTGESSYRLMNVVRGEPAAGLFEVPAGYTVKDSEIRQNFVIKRDAK